MDVHTQQQRSRSMAAIRASNTKPELELRRRLHAMGFRYRLHRGDLPGKPDIALAAHSAVIMVNGCFWHWHGCSLCIVPGTRTEWWQKKLSRTIERDHDVRVQLQSAGWRVCDVWECAFRGQRPQSGALDRTAAEIAKWIQGTAQVHQIPAHSGGDAELTIVNRLASVNLR